MKEIQTLHYKTVKENLHKNKLAFVENEITLCRKINTLAETTRISGDPLKWMRLTVTPWEFQKFHSEFVLASYHSPSPFLCKKMNYLPI